MPGSDSADEGDFADDGSFTDEGDFADDGSDVGRDDDANVGEDGDGEPTDGDAELEPDWAGTYEVGNYEKCDAKYPEEQEFLECMDGARP